MIVLKSKLEIEKMREPCAIVRDLLLALKDVVKVGVSTLEINDFAHNFILKHGATPSFLNYGGFPKSICVSLNQVVVHGIPSKHQIVKEGDIVSVDVGAYKNSFHSDAARTFIAGKTSLEKEMLVKITEESFFKGLEFFKVGERLGSISSAIQKHLEENGLSVVRDMVGHGIGKKLHEDPEVPNFGASGRGPRLEKGMTLAIEPMANLGTHQIEILGDGWTCETKDKLASSHYENTVYLGDNGVEILTL